LLHVDDGPTATEKVVYGGAGVATALKVGTGSVSVDNVRLDGNTISSLDVNGNINLTPNGTGNVVITNIQLATDLPITDGGTGASTASAARANLGLGTLATANTVDFLSVTGRQYGQFWSTADQTPAANTPTALTFNNSAFFNTSTGPFNGVVLGSGSRINYFTTGLYATTVRVQFVNTDAADHDAYVWFRKSGTDVADSGSITTVPKAADGGKAVIEVTIFEGLNSGQYLEVVVMVESAAVDIEAIAASAGPPTVPAVPSVILTTNRIGY
jgi:hypothetical protein